MSLPITIGMSRKDKQTLVMALDQAIKWTDSIIDAYTTEYNCDTHKCEVPKGFKSIVRGFERERKLFVKLLKRIEDENL